MNLKIGTKVTEVQPAPHWLHETLASKGLAVGDLVAYYYPSWNNHMTIYRIVKDSPPNHGAEWGSHRLYSTSMYNIGQGWVYPGTKRRMSYRVLQGYVEIEPVYQIIRGPYKPSNRKVDYRSLRRLKKLDVLELGRTFAGLKDFIESEVKKMSEI